MLACDLVEEIAPLLHLVLIKENHNLMKNQKIYLFVLLLLVLVGIYTTGWIGLILLNLVTFGLFGLDKCAAIKHTFRIPEKWLLLYCLLGGWIGGLFAQQLFRHKTYKQPFKSLFFLTIALDCLAVILYLSRGALLH